MLKLLLYLSILFSLTYADSITWVKTYKDALNLSINQNKRVMLLITSPTCAWCKKMKRETFTDNEVINEINENYISVELPRKNDEIIDNFSVKRVPTTLFISKDGNLIKKVTGYWNAENFLSWLSDVKKL